MYKVDRNQSDMRVRENYVMQYVYTCACETSVDERVVSVGIRQIYNVSCSNSDMCVRENVGYVVCVFEM